MSAPKLTAAELATVARFEQAPDALAEPHWSSADRLAAALALAIHDAHPVYGNTAGWRGGIGGQAMTQGCSFIDPPPGADWTQYDLLSDPLREWMQQNPDFNLEAAKAALKDELAAMLRGDIR